MNKVLVGVGIGCGSLVLIGIVASVAVGLWAKGKMEESGISLGQLEETGKRTQAVQKQIVALNSKYPFQAPPKGHPARLEEERLKEYLGVRAALTPLHQEIEQQVEALKPKEGEKGDVQNTFKAIGMMSQLFTGVREKWVVELDQRRMSPREYGAITSALHASRLGHASGRLRDTMMETKQELEAQAADERLTKVDRARARRRVKEVEAQLARLPATEADPGEITELHAHNAQLAEKYQKDLETYANPAFDALLQEHPGDEPEPGP